MPVVVWFIVFFQILKYFWISKGIDAMCIILLGPGKGTQAQFIMEK